MLQMCLSCLKVFWNDAMKSSLLKENQSWGKMVTLYPYFKNLNIDIQDFQQQRGKIMMDHVPLAIVLYLLINRKNGTLRLKNYY